LNRLEQIEQLAAELGPMPVVRDPRVLAQRSRDYYWYSPLLRELLDGKQADLIVSPRTEAEVIRVAAAVARRRVPLTVRGGGTGNYGQCVPLAGGVLLDTTALNRVIDISPGHMRVQAGALRRRAAPASS
jgi:FAD/FMN-containing dehydrogenase